MIPAEEKLLKPKEAAKLLGVHPLTLYRWAKSGKIRYVRTPTGRYLYPLSEINRILGVAPRENIGVIYIRIPREITREKKRLRDYVSQMKRIAERLKINVKNIIIDDEPIMHESSKFRTLIKLARRGEITHIVVPQGDIFSPLCTNLIKTIFEEGFGVKIVSLDIRDEISERIASLQLIESLMRLLSSRKKDLVRQLLGY